MNIENKFPSLKYLSRCYFNQGFEILFGSADETLNVYKNTETQEEQMKMKTEIEYLLSSCMDDSELQNILLNIMDCNYYYPNEWESSKAWLKHIIKQIS